MAERANARLATDLERHRAEDVGHRRRRRQDVANRTNTADDR